LPQILRGAWTRKSTGFAEVPFETIAQVMIG
jgi:hypothetical protein